MLKMLMQIIFEKKNESSSSWVFFIFEMYYEMLTLWKITEKTQISTHEFHPANLAGSFAADVSDVSGLASHLSPRDDFVSWK